MKDYSYYIPGYTGFCPDLREHFGETYGHATRIILREKPHLKDRLAPVFYKQRRSETAKRGGYRKYGEKSTKEKYNHPQMKQTADFLDPWQAKYRDDNDDDAHFRKYPGGDHEGNALRTCKHGLMYEDRDIRKEKHFARHDNGNNMRKENHECLPPRFIFVEGFAEYNPESLKTRNRRAATREPYPSVAVPCVHLNKRRQDTSQTKDYGHGPRLCRVPRIKPHRQDGVIPKYTGHIPGMVFSFGESYGPLSDRLLRRHHDCMNYLKRKI